MKKTVKGKGFLGFLFVLFGRGGKVRVLCLGLGSPIRQSLDPGLQFWEKNGQGED